MKKKKTSLDLMREIRTTWTINPRTRVHDNDIRKSKKKMRSESRKVVKKALGDEELFLFPAKMRQGTVLMSHFLPHENRPLLYHENCHLRFCDEPYDIPCFRHSVLIGSRLS